jgi:type I restriction enzyme R subunit
MVRLTKLIDDYNYGSMTVEDLLKNLVDLAKDLSVEETRAVSENLSEYELAIFDLLCKENLTKPEIQQVKNASKELLYNLRDKLVPGWREFDPLRSGVKIAISNVIYPKLPERVYSEIECKTLSIEIYQFVYERYPDASALVAL